MKYPACADCPRPSSWGDFRDHPELERSRAGLTPPEDIDRKHCVESNRGYSEKSDAPEKEMA